MRALTLTQPWAGLVASGIKLVENRPRQMIKREDFGKRFAIHASRVVDDQTLFKLVDEMSYSDEFTAYDGERVVSRPAFALAQRLWQVTSAVIAVATIDRMVVEWRDGTIVDGFGVNGVPIVELGAQRRWFFGPIGYVLRDVIALPMPVRCRGWQGFWSLEADIERQVRDQLGALEA